MTRPLCFDLFCGLGGWAEGFLAEGYEVIGFDIERHQYGDQRYPGQLALQDVLTLHGSQFRNAACIVASPPCQKYSYMAMPWTRAKALAAWYRDPGFIDERLADLNALFDACFRIQREACAAAGRHIPLIVENVKGAQPWVGRARWHYGSFYLWGDVPALMPFTGGGVMKLGVAHRSNGETNFHGSAAGAATKNEGGSWFNVAHNTESGVGQNPVNGVKQPGHSGRAWFADPDVAGHFSSKSPARKAASAMIAKIPFPLARHIASTFKPAAERVA